MSFITDNGQYNNSIYSISLDLLWLRIWLPLTRPLRFAILHCSSLSFATAHRLIAIDDVILVDSYLIALADVKLTGIITFEPFRAISL